MRYETNDVMFYGRKGAGKTISMVALSLMIKEREPDMVIYSNFHFARGFQYVFLETFDDLALMNNGICLLDDSERFVDSRLLSNSEKKRLLDICLDFGKNNMAVWYSCKRPLAVDKALRSVTSRFIRCERIPLQDGRFGIDLQTYDYQCMDRPLFRTIITDLEYYGSFYDTNEIVKPIH